MKALDNRLQTIADLVSEGAYVVDVGTDHGYLPIWLVGSGRARKAIAADLNQGPLNAACRSIAAAGLEGRIDICCTNGLRGISLEEVSDIVVAGMGGMLIAGILEERHPLAGKSLILQPMTQIPFLRRWLCEKGYRILEEAPAEVKGKFYTVIRCLYDGQTRECSEYYAQVGELPAALGMPGRQAAAGKYLRHLQHKFQDILCGIAQGATEGRPAERYRQLVSLIDQELEGSQWLP